MNLRVFAPRRVRVRRTWYLGTRRLQALRGARRASFSYDSWNGYTAERREIMDFIGSHHVSDVAFLKGDIHTFFAGNVTPSGREVAS